MATSTIERIVYEVDDGSGGTVLCIRGLGGISNAWTTMMPVLQRHCSLPGERVRVLAHEALSGCGHRTPVERPDACRELLRRFQSRRVI